MNPEDIIGNKKDLEKILKEVGKNSLPNKESSSEETSQEKTPQNQRRSGSNQYQSEQPQMQNPGMRPGQRQVPPFMTPRQTPGMQGSFCNNYDNAPQQVDSEDEGVQEEQDELDTNYNGNGNFQSQDQEADQDRLPSNIQPTLPTPNNFSGQQNNRLPPPDYQGIRYRKAPSSVGCDCDPMNEKDYCYCGKSRPAQEQDDSNICVDQQSRELSPQELGRLLKENLWGFALGILMSTYKKAVTNSIDDEAKFIRTDVQRFINQKGRHRFRSIPHQSIQDFIDECVASNDTLKDEEYIVEKDMREQCFKSGTIDSTIEGANKYHKARGNRDLFPYEDYSGNDSSDW